MPNLEETAEREFIEGFFNRPSPEDIEKNFTIVSEGGKKEHDIHKLVAYFSSVFVEYKSKVHGSTSDDMKQRFIRLAEEYSKLNQKLEANKYDAARVANFSRLLALLDKDIQLPLFATDVSFYVARNLGNFGYNGDLNKTFRDKIDNVKRIKKEEARDKIEDTLLLPVDYALDYALMIIGITAGLTEKYLSKAVDILPKLISHPLNALARKMRKPSLHDAVNLSQLIDPETEFLVVKHSHLNIADLDLEKVIAQAVGLEIHTNGREVVVALEGDLVQLENGEPILTHQSWHQVSQEKYRKLREAKIAVTLEEALAKVAEYKKQNPHKRVVLCLELKPITSKQTIQKALDLIVDYGLTDKDVYFDSFFGNKLDLIAQANAVNGTNYQRSFHLCGNVGNWKISIPFYGPKQGYDFLTVPLPVSFGKIKESVIYGAVGSVEQLAELAKDPNALGAYLRQHEGKGIRGILRMLWNSMTNLKNLRHGGVDPTLHCVNVSNIAYAGVGVR